MKYRVLLLAFGLACTLIAACAPTPQLRNDRFLQDQSLLTGEPCSAPCWRGITPGETTWSDARTIVEDDRTLAGWEDDAVENTPILVSVWSQAEGDRCCQMSSQDGEIVDTLFLQLAPTMTLGEVIEVHGEPAYAVGEVLTGDQAIFDLFYPDVPMQVFVFVQGETGEITEASEVVAVAYLNQERMELALNASNLHEWTGYAAYQDYMESDFEVTPSVTLTPIPESD